MLVEIRMFLEVNLIEVVIIFIEDYVFILNVIIKLFMSVGLMKYWMLVVVMLFNGSLWLILEEMI